MKRKYRLIDIIRVSFSLAKVTFRLRVEGSYLGIFWYLLNPLVLFAILLLVRLAAFPGEEISYFPLYLLIGIAGFNFFKAAITGAIDVINTNPDYIKSINRIAPESLVISVILQTIFSHIFEFVLIIILALYLQVPLIGILFYPLVLVLFSLMVLGISFIFSTIGTYVSDLNNIWLIISQLLLLATPIFYIISPGSLLYLVNLFNPLFYFLEIARPLIIYGQMPSLNLLLVVLALTVIFLTSGIMIFNKYKKKFAELL